MPDRFTGGGDRGNGAEKEKHDPEPVDGLVGRTVERLRASPALDATGFTHALLGRLRLKYPEIDVFVVAALVREEVQAGGVRNPTGLLIARLRILRAEHRGAVAQRVPSTPVASQISEGDAQDRRLVAPRATSHPTPSRVLPGGSAAGDGDPGASLATGTCGKSPLGSQ
jgi:hypothetical protein